MRTREMHLDDGCMRFHLATRTHVGDLVLPHVVVKKKANVRTDKRCRTDGNDNLFLVGRRGNIIVVEKRDEGI